MEESPVNDPNQSRTVCLKRGMFTFTIFDVYEDGVCCECGMGNYTLVYQGRNDDNGSEEKDKVIAASGGVFSAIESTPFSVPNEFTCFFRVGYNNCLLSY